MEPTKARNGFKKELTYGSLTVQFIGPSVRS